MVNVRRPSATTDETDNMIQTARSGCVVKYAIGYNGDPSRITVTLPDDVDLTFVEGGVTITGKVINPAELLDRGQYGDYTYVLTNNKTLVVEYKGASTPYLRGIALEEHEEPLQRTANALLHEVNTAIDRNRARTQVR